MTDPQTSSPPLRAGAGLVPVEPGSESVPTPAQTGQCSFCGKPAVWTNPVNGYRICQNCLKETVQLTTSDEVPDPTGHPGGEWVFSAPDEVPSIWGVGSEVAWPAGEALIIYGSDGSGKTAAAHNLIVRQLGIVTTPLFGLTVLPRSRVLYLAQDRPRQAQRALKRMVGTIDQEVLDAGLRVIDWPLDSTLEDDPDLLVKLAAENGADTLYVDSLKDVVRSVSDEESGLAIRRAYSKAIAEGVEVCVLHHDRKPGQDSRRKTMALADVYGSRFITAGAGSVIALNGGSGDPIIELRQVKQAAGEVGPLHITLDFITGEMGIHEGTDLLSLLKASATGITANDAARALYSTEAPTAKERERARRKLDTLVGRDKAVKKPGDGPQDPTLYLNADIPLTLSLTQGVQR